MCRASPFSQPKIYTNALFIYRWFLLSWAKKQLMKTKAFESLRDTANRGVTPRVAKEVSEEINLSAGTKRLGRSGSSSGPLAFRKATAFCLITTMHECLAWICRGERRMWGWGWMQGDLATGIGDQDTPNSNIDNTMVLVVRLLY